MEQKVSIIIPVYNVKDYIDQCIQSVVNQTYKDIEIILVDDGSTDGSSEICDQWVQKDLRIQCIHQRNAGVSVARNSGLKRCSGQYIMFVDGDDEVASDMCEKLLNAILDNEADMSYCGFLYIFSDEIKKNIPSEKILNNRESLYAVFNDPIFFKGIWNKMFKKDIVYHNNELIQFAPELHMSEDTLWLTTVMKNINCVVSVPFALYYWKSRQDSATAGGQLNNIPLTSKYLTQLEALRRIALEVDDANLQKKLLKEYLGQCRDLAIRAVEQKKLEIKKNTINKINSDLYLYNYIDFFFIKLKFCVFLIQVGAPAKVIELVNCIKGKN